MKPVILITGCKGQLGSELVQLAPAYPVFDFIFTDKEELDITTAGEVNAFFNKQEIAYCINAAAYTAVDKAESDKEIALAVNETAVANLASACRQHGSRLLHVSTDYVFDGTATTPYTEQDKVNPVNFYGETKLKGEEAALKNPDAIIVRTSWVYSRFGNNFVKTMLRLMNERESISVVSDQVGSPTYAADLAKALVDIVSVLNAKTSKAGGVYHYSNDGVISWYDFAVAIAELSGSKCKVVPIPTSAYPTPAKRPAYSVLSKAKIVRAFGVAVPHWKESLEQFFK